MPVSSIENDSMSFLTELSKNNNRDWFNNNKENYASAHANIITFAAALLDEMNKHDQIETASGRKSVFRIYRDVRFSKDKTPYNTHWSGSFRRATKKRRGGYYFRIEPGNSFAACGFWGPDPADMKRIRQHIDLNYEDWRALLQDKLFTGTFVSLRGEQLGSAPRGYAKDHPAIDLLRYKQFILKFPFTDKQVHSPSFVSDVNDVFKKMRPFLDFMSEVLTTDANGVSVVD